MTGEGSRAGEGEQGGVDDTTPVLFAICRMHATSSTMYSALRPLNCMPRSSSSEAPARASAEGKAKYTSSPTVRPVP